MSVLLLWGSKLYTTKRNIFRSWICPPPPAFQNKVKGELMSLLIQKVSVGFFKNKNLKFKIAATVFFCLWKKNHPLSFSTPLYISLCYHHTQRRHTLYFVNKILVWKIILVLGLFYLNLSRSALGFFSFLAFPSLGSFEASSICFRRSRWKKKKITFRNQDFFKKVFRRRRPKDK